MLGRAGDHVVVREDLAGRRDHHARARGLAAAGERGVDVDERGVDLLGDPETSMLTFPLDPEPEPPPSWPPSDEPPLPFPKGLLGATKLDGLVPLLPLSETATPTAAPAAGRRAARRRRRRRRARCASPRRRVGWASGAGHGGGAGAANVGVGWVGSDVKGGAVRARRRPRSASGSARPGGGRPGRRHRRLRVGRVGVAHASSLSCPGRTRARGGIGSAAGERLPRRRGRQGAPPV